MTDDELLTVDDVASYLKIPKSTAYRYMHRAGGGTIGGKHLRIRKSMLDAWIDKQLPGPRPPRARAERVVYEFAESRLPKAIQDGILRRHRMKPAEREAFDEQWKAWQAQRAQQEH